MNVRTALIGHTGFVGSNLCDSHRFDDVYNSRNLADLAGREYDLVVSAAGRADSHRINQHGDEDRAELDALADTIERAHIARLVLISTVCVYPWGGAPDERTPLAADELTPYGANRLHLEQRLSAAFDTLVVRLPQLYGRRLRKGVVYDLIHDYRVEHIDPDLAFQHYDVRALWRDIGVAGDAGLTALNVATPPIGNAELAREVFGMDITANPRSSSPHARMYTRNMTTRHAALFGGDGPYLTGRDDEMRALRAFAAETSDSE